MVLFVALVLAVVLEMRGPTPLPLAVPRPHFDESTATHSSIVAASAVAGHPSRALERTSTDIIIPLQEQLARILERLSSRPTVN